MDNSKENMKLLIITQKVDEMDSVLGFFIDWLGKFAQKLDKVYVICLAEGVHHLPDNVKVFSLGKEKNYSKIKQFFRLQKFLLTHLKEVDGVFCHMCPIYVLMSFPLSFVFRKRIILWYLHKAVDWQLKLANKMVYKLLTASAESCNLKDRSKIEIIGHGIDQENFSTEAKKYKRGKSRLKLLYVGRISPIKDLVTLITAVEILSKKKKIDLLLTIVGEGVDKKEKEYEKEIVQMIQKKGLLSCVNFLGPVEHKAISRFYLENDILVNLCPTGGLDKVVLEAMMVGCLPLVANISFRDNFGEYADILLFQEKSAKDLAEKIIALNGLPIKKKNEISNYLRNTVEKNHNLSNLIAQIVAMYAKGE